MEENYPIYLGEEAIGTAQVTRQGLYYHFSCRCRLSGEIMCRILVTCGNHQEHLGILVPVGSSFGLDTKLAVKKLGKGPFRFRVLPKRQDMQGQFTPIRPEEPFAYITRLQNAFMETRNGQVGVVIAQMSSTSPTGQ